MNHYIKRIDLVPESIVQIGTRFKETVTDCYNNQTRSVREERKDLIQQINELTTRTHKARELLLLDEIESGEFRKIKDEANEKINRLEAKLNEVLLQNSTLLDIKPIAEAAIKSLELLDKLYDDANVKGKKVPSRYFVP